MTRIHAMKPFVTAALLAAVASAGCAGEFVRQDRSPVTLVIDSLEATSGSTGNSGGTLQSDVRTKGGIFSDSAVVTLRAIMKNPGSPTNPVTPSAINAVTINRYRVRYVRADGRNTPGVDVPYGFDGAATVTVPTGGETVDLLFELVRHVAKQEPPLASLVTDSAIITTLAEVTFYGRDQVGNDISVTGTVQVDFGNFGF